MRFVASLCVSIICTVVMYCMYDGAIPRETGNVIICVLSMALFGSYAVEGLVGMVKDLKE